jgi:hypothetical protein
MNHHSAESLQNHSAEMLPYASAFGGLGRRPGRAGPHVIYRDFVASPGSRTLTRHFASTCRYP